MHLSTVSSLALLVFASTAYATGNLVERATPASCTTSLATPTPTTLTCDVAGSVKSPVPIATATAATFPICRNSCLDTAGCASFSFSKKKCIKYSQSLAKMKFTKGNTGVIFAARGCFKSQCSCSDSSLSLCGKTCADTQSDNNNCGKCGTTCTGGQSCQQGVCACPSPKESFCNGACINTQYDSSNCGSCGNVCNQISTCQLSQCQQQPFYLQATNTSTSADGLYFRGQDQNGGSVTFAGFDTYNIPQQLTLQSGTNYAVNQDGQYLNWISIESGDGNIGIVSPSDSNYRGTYIRCSLDQSTFQFTCSYSTGGVSYNTFVLTGQSQYRLQLASPSAAQGRIQVMIYATATGP